MYHHCSITVLGDPSCIKPSLYQHCTITVKAQLKLSKFTSKIGYPDKWKDYSTLLLEEGDDLHAVVKKVKAFIFETEFLKKINAPKDKTEWEMHPQVVNAYFHPMNNEIVFPAAILQPPFYQKSVEDVQFGMGDDSAAADALLAINFGAIGAVIAHEITHGYDDQGRKFDSDGNINDWWQEADTELFTSKTDLMAGQAETWRYEEEVEGGDPKIHQLNGQLTMGENLADLGGMSLAMQALLKRLEETHAGLDAAAVSQHQRLFFMSWANVWKQKQSKADIIQKLATDPHAPTSFRGNLVKNIDSFYTAFGVNEGAAMYLAPEKRVNMW